MNEYLKVKIDELETKSKIINISDLYEYRVINDFKKGYQPKFNTVKDEKGDWITDCHVILARWGNHFSLLFDVRGINDVLYIHTYIHM